jgi:hypothetical protein
MAGTRNAAAQIVARYNTRRTTTICPFVPYSGIPCVHVFAQLQGVDERPDLPKNGEFPALTRNRDGVDFATSGPARKRAQRSETRFDNRTVSNEAATQRPGITTEHDTPRHAQDTFACRWESASVRDCQRPHYRHERGGAST